MNNPLNNNKQRPRANKSFKKKKQNTLLSIAGRNNLNNCTKPSLIYIRKDTQQDIDKYCSGSKQTIVNYLLRRALDDLIAENKLVVEEP